jgi:nicotinate (nicotinamide) nucleotide adenylyltransferase
MKTALFGGTFDPIHNEHISICLNAKKQFAIDRVFVLPAGRPPHKNSNKLTASPEDRFNMAQIAFKGEKDIAVSDYEIQKKQPSYTVETLKHFSRQFPSDELYLIIGADSLINFKKWYKYEEILTLCSIIVCGREGISEKDITRQMQVLKKESPNKILLCDYKGRKISSTALKVFLEFGFDCINYIDSEVLGYIRQNNLYTNYAFYVEKLKAMLSPKRYTHTVYTVISALELADKTGCDYNKTFLAAALHDCTKKLSDKELYDLGFVLKTDVPEPVSHSVSGSFIARTVFNIKDKDILNSIRYHTTGRKGMSLLERVIYVADCIEFTRDYEGVDMLRSAVEKDFETGFLKCMELTIQQLKANENKEGVSDMTEKAYEYYIENRKNGEVYDT